MSEPKSKNAIDNEGLNNNESGASVEKIRDILFGSQIKNYETRFARLEDTLVRESSDLKETMKRRFESLEGFFKRETEAMTARIKAEREERTESLKNISRELKASHEALTKKIGELDNKSSEGQSGLRQELMTESRKLLEEIRQRHDSLAALLERRVDELRQTKTDRSLLSALLTEIATQLNEDAIQPPAKQAKSAKIG
jgi:uncharacterized protein YydD (DUF2326 family)